MCGRPHGECAFGEVAEERNDETRGTENTADVTSTDAATAKRADILAGAHFEEVITGGKAAEEVRAQHEPTGLGPVGGLELFNPRHISLFVPTILHSAR